jgi:hypothetical protein
LSLDVHESAVNNLAAGMLAGQTVREDHLAERMAELFGWQPEGLRPSDPEKLWSVQFHQEQPLAVEFHEGVVTVTLQTAGFTAGEQAIPGMRLQVAYRLSVDESGLTGSRLGRIEITRLDAWNDSDKVGVRYQVFRSMLRRRFERVFPAEFALARLPLPESWPQQASLYFSQCDADTGWLQLACSLSQPQTDTLARRGE